MPAASATTPNFPVSDNDESQHVRLSQFVARLFVARFFVATTSPVAIKTVSQV